MAPLFPPAPSFKKRVPWRIPNLLSVPEPLFIYDQNHPHAGTISGDQGTIPGFCPLLSVGDFFEMFYEDALLASRILEITLTSRHKGELKDQVPMCGVPVHAVSGYVARMVEKGYKVALCEQVEDPAQAQGIVRREVTRLITPGLYIDDTSIKSNRYC